MRAALVLLILLAAGAVAAQNDPTVEDLEFDRTGARLAVAYNGMYSWLDVIDMADRELLQQFTYPMQTRITDIKWNPVQTDRLAISVNDPPVATFISVADVATGQEVAQLPVHAEVYAVDWSPDGRFLAVALSYGADQLARRSIQIWDAESWQVDREFFTGGPDSYALAWSPNGLWIASAGLDNDLQSGPIYIQDAQTGEIVRTLFGQPISSYALKWSPDGSRIASGTAFLYGGQSIRVWDPGTGENLLTLTDTDAIDLDWSPDGQAIASVDLDTISIWDSVTGELVDQRDGSQLRTAAWSPTGEWIASGGVGTEIVIETAPIPVQPLTPTAPSTPTPTETPTSTLTP